MGALFNLNDFGRSMFINEQRRQTFVKLLFGYRNTNAEILFF